jgi:hypothetical protein
MSLTRDELHDILLNGSPSQQKEAQALLNAMEQKEATPSSPEGTVMLRGFKGQTFSLPGCAPCPENHPNRMCTWERICG